MNNYITIGILIISVVIFPVSAYTQISVTDKSPGTTEVEFQSEDEAEILLIRESDADEPICLTPCNVLLPNGDYKFRIDKKVLNLHAEGELQIWEVENKNVAGMAFGAILIGTGGVSVIFGLLVTLIEGLSKEPMGDKDFKTGWIWLCAGVVTIVPGVTLFVNSLPSFEQIDNSSTELSEINKLSHWPKISQSQINYRAWGFGLRVTF